MTLPKFYKNQLEKEMLIAKLQRSSSLYNIFKKKKDLTKEIDEDIKSRFHQELQGFCAILITGSQNCQPEGSKILMANGEWKNIEEIKTGDMILSPQKDQTYIYAKVTNTSKWFSTKNYDILTTKKKQKILYSCSEKHLIPMNKCFLPRINPKLDKRSRLWEIKHYTPAQIETKSLSWKQHASTILASPIPSFLNKQNCEIEPYTLGYYLGNGYFGKNKVNPTICCNDKKPIEYIKKQYSVMSEYQKKGTTTKDYNFSKSSKLCQELTKYKLKGKKAGTKNIPVEALTSDIEYRKKLLAGIIDSDGNYFEKRGLSITTKSEQLANDISNLSYSLGIRNSITQIKGKIKSYNFEGKYYKICLLTKNLDLPILCERKKPKKNDKLLSSNRTSIDVKKRKPEMVYGITIESPSSWYITDNWCITHNSNKSGLAQETAMENDPTFNAERIHFLYNNFRKALENAKKGEWYILDENVFISGIGSQNIIQSIQTLIEVIRQAQISVILITPTRKYLPEHIFTHHFETIDRSLIGKCPKNDDMHDIRTCQEPKHNHMEATIRSAIIREGEYVGFYIKKLHWNNKIWQEYQEKKKEFLTQALAEDFQKLSYEDTAKEIISNPKSKEYKTGKQLQLYLEQELPNLTVGQKMLLIEAIKIQRAFEEEIEREKL